MNWEDYEAAERENFSPIRQELVTGCKECSARLTGSDEKNLKKRRKQHFVLHMRSAIYMKSMLERIGLKEAPSGKLLEYFEQLTDSLARQLHSDFKNYLRFELDSQEVWPRLKVGQKGHLEWLVKQEWRSLDDREKDGFIKLAKEFVESAFPEASSSSKDMEPLLQ